MSDFYFDRTVADEDTEIAVTRCEADDDAIQFNLRGRGQSFPSVAFFLTPEAAADFANAILAAAGRKAMP